MAPETTRPHRRPVLHLLSDVLPRGPWVFARLLRPPTDALEDGVLVELRDASDRFVGHGFYNAASDIRVRLLGRGRRRDLDRPREFLLARLKSADDLRRRVLRLHEQSDAYRVVHAEADDLSGLIVDRLGPVLVCEHHALGFWYLREEVEWALGQLYPACRVLHRIPVAARKQEGFERLGEAPAEPPEERIEIEENGIRYALRPGAGHKTGFFCDQRENRLLVGALARGREVLDLCCNLGGFALHAARGGARRVRAVDLDETVLAEARATAALNGLAVEYSQADAFDALRAEGPRPELIVLDPPKLIPSRAAQETGLRKYRDLNSLAFAKLRPGGLLATFSCSGLLREQEFVGLLFQAGRRAERGLRLLRSLGPGPDHPQRPDFARSRYLKGALLAVD